MNEVLVTGGGGFLGGAIIERLVEKGVKVRSISRNRYPRLTALGVEQFQGSITDVDLTARACKGVDTIFHTAAKAGIWGDYQAYYQTNVKGTETILQACRSIPDVKLIHTSSPSVVFDGGDMEGADESVPYPETYHTHYPKTKAMAERLVIDACRNGLQAIILRPHLIWGPGDNHLVPRILARAGRLRKIGDRENKVDTIYIDNAAEAHLAAEVALSRHPDLSGQVYFISQDDPVPLWNMVNRILSAGGKPAVQRTISYKSAYRIGGMLEFFYKMMRIKREPPMTRFLAQELSTAHWFDISAAKKDLEYVPKVTIEEGLKRLSRWLT